MARMARLVIPGIPHHVTQRGAGRAPTFFRDQNYALYRALLAEGLLVWRYLGGPWEAVARLPFGAP